MNRRTAWLAGLLLAASVVAVSSRRLEAAGKPVQSWDLLYLPNGRYLAVASLGQRTLVADLVYLWAIQYYGHYEIANRYENFDRIFGDVISELDPRYVDPYWIGALILTVETKDLERALRLLEKGMTANPDQWLLPYLAGWECYHAGQLDRAAAYFDRAIHVPGSPAVIRRTSAAMYEKKGDRATSLAAWKAIAEDPAVDERAREIADRHIRQLQAEQNLDTLRQIIARYTSRRGRPPASIDALVSEGWLDRVPFDAEGRPYVYDRHTGQVTTPGSRVLEAP